MKQFALALLAFPVLLAQGTDYVKANYTKYEYQIPMRDGNKLFTSVYVPKDRSKPLPIMLLPDLFAREGFIFAYQDVRGRGMSEGEFVNAPPAQPPQGPHGY